MTLDSYQKKTKKELIQDIKELQHKYIRLESFCKNDNNARTLSESVLNECDYRFKKLVEHAPISMAILSLNGDIEFINHKALDEFGYRIEDIKTVENWWLNAYPDEKYRNEVKSLWVGYMDKAMKNGSQIEGREYLVTCKNGRVKNVYSSGVIVAERVFILFDDITERKQAEIQIHEKNEAIEAKNKEYLRLNEELLKINKQLIKAKEQAEESDRLKTSFLQNMSHEIRTPMNAIMGFSSLLADNYNNKAKLEKFSEIINSRCIDLLEIINDILDISKIESGQLLVHNEECNLIDLFTELRLFFKEHQKRVGKDQIRFNLQFLCGLHQSTIIVDKVKLKQILINLISNAFKFTEEGSIEGGCKLDENHNLIFFVSDTGIGIPLDKYEMIFERFSQLNDYKIKNYGGTGLGLSIVKGLINLMGGKVWLESVPEDKNTKIRSGTTFYFSFPGILSPSGMKAISHNEDEQFNFSNLTLLAVEDDEFNTVYIKEILSKTGIRIIHTSNGHEAINIALIKKPDIILMDIRLPDIDGYEVIRQIRITNPFSRIIAQTAYAGNEDRKKAFDSGCVDYISKPLKRELLLSLIRKHLV